MKKIRVKQVCPICETEFEVRPCEINSIVTCSKDCSIKKRSIVATGRKIACGDKIWETRRANDKPIDKSYITEEFREKCRQRAINNGLGKSNKGIKLSDQHCDKIRQAHIGHNRGGWNMSEEICKKRQDRSKKGEDSNFWKGGVTKENALIRTSYEYKKWRREVFKRDNYTCQICGDNNTKLHADHIKPFAYFKELRFDISNGRTLCVPCHKATPTFLGGARKLFE